MRKFLSFFTALAVIFSVCGSAFAVEDVNMLDENDYEALNDTDAEIINRVEADEYEMPDAIDEESEVNPAEDIMVQAAAEDTLEEFDFSANDPIDKYASYPKKTLAGKDIEYVKVVRNQYSSTSSWTADEYRYGAFLTAPNENQYYLFTNIDYGGKLDSSVLTVYADPEVKFEVTNALGEVVVSSVDGHKPEKVSYYNHVWKNGHAVYYADLKPASASENGYLIRFYTESETVKPHYSLWFGHPVMKSATAPFISAANASVRRPYTSSSVIKILSPYMPKRAWVTNVRLKKSSDTNRAYLLGGNVTIFAPGMSTNRQSCSISDKEAVFDYEVSYSSAYKADGTYAIQLNNMRWNPDFNVSVNYQYQSTIAYDYVYAIGS